MGLSLGPLDLKRIVPARPPSVLPRYAVERRTPPDARPLAERMAHWGVPGLSVAVVAPGEPVRTAACGVAVAGGPWLRAGAQDPCPLEPDGAGDWVLGPLSVGVAFAGDALLLRQNGVETLVPRI